MALAPDLLQTIDRAPALACSACLLGVCCRYDGAQKRAPKALLERLLLRQADAALRASQTRIWRLFAEESGLRGGHRLGFEEIFEAFLPRGIVPLCPEIFGGLGCPRPPADFSGGDGSALLKKRARLIDRLGADVSEAFVRGARMALSIARAHDIQAALLKEGSPSCGVRRVQCGAVKIQGLGVTAALFERAGIRLFSEEDFTSAALL